jgi:hypothetical protein
MVNGIVQAPILNMSRFVLAYINSELVRRSATVIESKGVCNDSVVYIRYASLLGTAKFRIVLGFDRVTVSAVSEGRE